MAVVVLIAHKSSGRLAGESPAEVRVKLIRSDHPASVAIRALKRCHQMNSGNSPTSLTERFQKLRNPNQEDIRLLRSEMVTIGEDLKRQNELALKELQVPIPIPLPCLHGVFVDRENERFTIHQSLQKGDNRLVAIVAPGGYGKTELIAKFLNEIAVSTKITDPNVKGILYLRCIGADVSLGRIFAKAGSIVGKSDAFQKVYESQEFTMERKLEFFFHELSQAGNVLIVMDNFEDLLDSDDCISELELRKFLEFAVATQHTVRFLATTRALPSFQGSRSIQSIDLSNGLPEDQAIAYLRESGNDYGLADEDVETLRGFVRRVHCIPKALESIIGFLSEKYPYQTLSDMMKDDTLFEAFDRYDTENGLKMLISRQFKDQTADAKLVLCALSAFRKPIPLTALRHLLPALDFSNVIPHLERNKLVSRQGVHFDMHPIVRSFAYAQIPDKGDFSNEILHRNAANFYLSVTTANEIQTVEYQFEGCEQLIRAKDFDWAAQILWNLRDNAFAMALNNHILEMCDRLIDLDKDVGGMPYVLRGDCLETRGDHEASMKEFRKALTLPLDEKIKIWALFLLGLCHYELQQYDAAEETFLKCIASSEQIEHLPGLQISHHKLGDLYRVRGRREDAALAEKEYEQSISLLLKIGNDDRTIAGAYRCLGDIRVMTGGDIKGAYNCALERYQKILVTDRQSGIVLKWTWDLLDIGRIFRRLGDYLSAKESLTSALEGLEAVEPLFAKGYAVRALLDMALIEIELNEHAKAVEFLVAVRQIGESFGPRWITDADAALEKLKTPLGEKAFDSMLAAIEIEKSPFKRYF